MGQICWCLMVIVGAGVLTVRAQTLVPSGQAGQAPSVAKTKMETTEDWNRRIEELVHSALSKKQAAPSAEDYRIGPEDLLKITVLDAPDLSHSVRVAADGQISVPMLGSIKAAGLTSRELELVLEALLRRTYMKDPHVAVTVAEMQSHSVSVLGAVKKPGVFQIRGTKTVLEMLSMAQGLTPEAGDAVLVMRAAGDGAGAEAAGGLGTSTAAEPSGITENGNAVEISLKRLLDSGDPRYNVPVYPGDIVKVKAAGIVYVVGDVVRPGGFPVKDNEHITVLQAIALGEGLGPNADKGKASIIRVAENGQQTQLPVQLNKIMEGKMPDFPLHPKDILFIPKNGAKAAGRSVLTTLSQWLVWRGIP